MNSQQNFYKLLTSYTHPEDLKVALVNFDTKINNYIPGKRYNSSKYQIFDERNVAVNEIIWDFDWKSWKANYQKAKLVLNALDNRSIPYYICATGGKGVHIHTFFNKLIFDTDNEKKLFRKALSYGLSYKNIRLWLFNLILQEADIDPRFIGKGKQIDSAPITFNYYSGTTHLIRAIGGRKYTKNNEGEWIPHYKTYITREEFTHKKISIDSFDKVKYPNTIPVFDIDKNELLEFLNNFIKNNEQGNSIKLTNEKIDGKYIDLDGILKIREGMQEGRRSAGASVIAIACKIDDLTKDEAYQIMEEYVINCSQMGSPFVSSEGKRWIDWIYNHEKPYWNCQLLKDLDCHDQNTCEHCKLKYKEAYKFLTQTTILDQIKEVLDMEIIGESHTKMLTFLLLLSKDFPSKTGKPGWNIPSDSMSQNIILSSDSSSGKSWMTKKILELFGEEMVDYFVVSRITKNAINYYTDINMDGKIIFIEELQGLDENTSQIRVWMSEGKLSLDTVEKVLDDEGKENNALVRKSTTGQPVFITNQAEGSVEDQLNNRSWVLSMDNTEFQTANILDYQDKLAQGVYNIDKTKIRKISDALKQLKPYHFIIPFINRVNLGIPVGDVRSRRDYQKFLTLIKCSAYLHQRQREITVDDDGNEYIICDIKDYDIARQYSSNVLGATFSGLTNAQIDLINYIRNCNWNAEFYVSDIMRNLGKSQPHWYGMMTQLENLGYVTAQKSIGNSTTYSLVKDKAINIISLPSGDELMKKYNEHKPIGPISCKIKKPENDINQLINTKTEKLENQKEQLIGLIGHPPFKMPEFNMENLSTATFINAEHLLNSEGLNIFDFFISYIINQEKKNNKVSNKDLFIGALSRTQVTEYMKKTPKHQVPFEDLSKYFKVSDEYLEEVLHKLKSEGTIFEPLPGRYMLL